MKKDEIREILGSNRVIEVETKKLDGPLTYLNLLREVNTRITTKVGRPTDIRTTRYHNIPLTDETWEQLKEKAKVIPGKKTLSASHLAAFIIEEGLKRLDEEIDKYDLTGTASLSREIVQCEFSLKEVAEILDISIKKAKEDIIESFGTLKRGITRKELEKLIQRFKSSNAIKKAYERMENMDRQKKLSKNTERVYEQQR